MMILEAIFLELIIPGVHVSYFSLKPKTYYVCSYRMFVILNICFNVVQYKLVDKRGFGDLEDDEDDIFSSKKVSFNIDFNYSIIM